MNMPDTTKIQPESSFPGRWWRTLEDQRIECRLCPRFCHLKDGQRGFCYVRKNEAEQMVLTTYGRSSGFCIDPIEKKPLNHFYPGTPVLSFGTAGCNLGCRFCQNWDISKSRSMDRLMSRALPEDIARLAGENHCQSVAFTYNDPVIFAEYAIDTARACRQAGIQTVMVSAGYITTEARSEFFSLVDAANIDLKAFSEDFYKKICYGQMQPVLDTLRYLKQETDVWLEVTTLLIPGQNDDQEQLKAMCDWFLKELGPEVPLHFTAFHPDFKMQDIQRTPPETLIRARNIALKAGLHYVYLGNVHNSQAGSTWCPDCGQLLVERDWFALGSYNLSPSGCCNRCGHKVPGRWQDGKGNWSGGRLPLEI